jgi:hypothetical protein
MHYYEGSSLESLDSVVSLDSVKVNKRRGMMTETAANQLAKVINELEKRGIGRFSKFLADFTDVL